MIDRPTTRWWAFFAVSLLAACPVLADPAAGQRETAGQQQIAESLLPEPVLETGLMKSHRKDSAWLEDPYYAGEARGPMLDAGLLESILDGLSLPEAAAETSFFEDLETWLNTYLGNGAEPVLPDWVRNFRLPEATMLWVFYVSCALIVVLAIAIIVNEVRHARGGRKLTSQRTPAATGSASSEAVDLRPTSLFELPGCCSIS